MNIIRVEKYYPTSLSSQKMQKVGTYKLFSRNMENAWRHLWEASVRLLELLPESFEFEDVITEDEDGIWFISW